MTVERALRALAGGFVLLSLVLGWFIHAGFYLLTAFVGLNLLQSAFTDWCPAMWAFRKMGLREAGEAPASSCCAPEGMKAS
jgi:hypothetical protein